AIFAARLDQLSPTQRRVVEAAAVIGLVFTAEAADAIRTGAEANVDGEVAGIMESLVTTGILEPVELRVTGGAGFGFRHPSLRDVAYDLTLKADRAAMHEA